MMLSTVGVAKGPCTFADMAGERKFAAVRELEKPLIKRDILNRKFVHRTRPSLDAGKLQPTTTNTTNGILAAEFCWVRFLCPSSRFSFMNLNDTFQKKPHSP